MSEDEIQIPADMRLPRCPDTPVGARWPWPVHRRLDALVRQAEEEGETTSRKEMLAAIVCDFDPEKIEMGRMLRDYRLSTAGQVALTEPTPDNVIRITPNPQGRPARKHSP